MALSWHRPLVAALLVLAGGSAFAAPTHKCVIQGTVTYQQAPCSSGDQPRREPTLAELNAAEKLRRAASANPATATPRAAEPAPTRVAPSSEFRCDGRQYCSQMRSCAEARYFLAHCPNVKMDGDRNGIPCEQQWCRP